MRDGRGALVLVQARPLGVEIRGTVCPRPRTVLLVEPNIHTLLLCIRLCFTSRTHSFVREVTFLAHSRTHLVTTRLATSLLESKPPIASPNTILAIQHHVSSRDNSLLLVARRSGTKRCLRCKRHRSDNPSWGSARSQVFTH